LHTFDIIVNDCSKCGNSDYERGIRKSKIIKFKLENDFEITCDNLQRKKSEFLEMLEKSNSNSYSSGK